MNASTDIRREEGFAMYIVVMVMMVTLTLGAALSSAGGQSSRAVDQDELAVRALQAAEAGAQAAVHRLNLQQPPTSKCIRTSAADPQSGNAWCSATSAESVGNNASYSYQTSVPLTTGCTGVSYGAPNSERCIVSVGTAGGVTRRVVQRVVSSTGSDPFPTNGIVGKDGIYMNNNNVVNAGLGTNGQLQLGNGSTITGGVSLWQGAPNPIGYAGPVIRTPQPFVFSPPSMLNGDTQLDSKSSNDNGRIISGLDTCSSSCYVNTGASPRTLNLGNSASVTLGGSVYNFCQITLGNGASVNIAAGAKAVIYIDSPTRPGSGCVAGQGGMSTGNNAIFSNPSQDPTALQIVIYGQAPAWPSIDLPNNIKMYAAVYAPDTAVGFKNSSEFVGGITAKTVTFKNNAFSWDGRVADVQLRTSLVYYRGSWRQCNSRAQASTAPSTGCL